MPPIHSKSLATIKTTEVGLGQLFFLLSVHNTLRGLSKLAAPQSNDSLMEVIDTWSTLAMPEEVYEYLLASFQKLAELDAVEGMGLDFFEHKVAEWELLKLERVEH